MSKAKAEAPTGTEVGCAAPDFELRDGDGRSWRLSDYRSKKVVAMIFYPRDETPVCTKQMCSIRDRWAEYEDTGAEVVGISIGSVDSHKKFAEHHNLPQRLLSDEACEVARTYNVKSFLGGAQRAVIVIDRDGIISYRKTVLPIFRPSDDLVLAAIKSASDR